jgi:hypothetical protein
MRIDKFLFQLKRLKNDTGILTKLTIKKKKKINKKFMCDVIWNEIHINIPG